MVCFEKFHIYVYLNFNISRKYFGNTLSQEFKWNNASSYTPQGRVLNLLFNASSFSKYQLVIFEKKILMQVLKITNPFNLASPNAMIKAIKRVLKSFNCYIIEYYSNLLFQWVNVWVKISYKISANIYTKMWRGSILLIPYSGFGKLPLKKKSNRTTKNLIIVWL